MFSFADVIGSIDPATVQKIIEAWIQHVNVNGENPLLIEWIVVSCGMPI